MEKNEMKEIEIIERIPVYLERTEDGWLISDAHGYEYSAIEMLDIAQGLELMANEYEEEIEDRILEHDFKLSALWHKTHCYDRGSNDCGGYVYMMECGGKYKIGYSKDVERRFHELDKRPFSLHVFAVSNKIPNALRKEQEIHSKLGSFRLTGEWYKFTDEQALKIKRVIESLGNNKDGNNG